MTEQANAAAGAAVGDKGASGAGAGDGAKGGSSGSAGAGDQGAAAAAAAAASAASAAASAGGAHGADKGNAGGAEAGKGTPAGQAGAIWGEDWREQYSKEDTGRLNILKRYTSPAAALDALFAARQRIESGELKTQLPKDATPEQLAAYRTERGIPEKPEGYLEKLPEGFKIQDYNKDLASFIATNLHTINAPPEMVHQGIKIMSEWQDKQIEARVAADNTLKTTTEDALRADWGNDYRANIGSIHALLGGAPEEVSEAILQARTPDGNPLVGTPQVVRWLAQVSREMNPVSTIIPSANGSTSLAAADTRIAEIEKYMRTDNAKYVKDEKVQAEYRALIDARDTMKRRSAA